VLPRMRAFVAALPDREVPRASWSPDWRRFDEGLTAPAQVNFAGKGGSLYDCGYELRGSIFAVLKYVRTTWIWERVRVQGGAYGGMVQFDPVSGFFGYLSFRDPNIVPTLRVYDGTAGFLEEVTIDADELRKSIIGAVGDMEPCLLPDAQGNVSLRRYLTGVTDQERQRLRDELLGTSVADFRTLGGALRRLNERGLVVALGSPERIREANATLGDRLRVTAVL
jgi:Zn-dependent M16 (insulinase) family peptidase